MDGEYPVRVAFCPLLFAANGGRFDELGRPYTPTDSERVLGKCDVAHDCGVCPYLHQWVEAKAREGWSVGWECIRCVKAGQTSRTADKSKRLLPGFYQASRYREQVDPEQPAEDLEPEIPLDGCTSCGWGSAFLQLILRRP